MADSRRVEKQSHPSNQKHCYTVTNIIDLVLPLSSNFVFSSQYLRGIAISTSLIGVSWFMMTDSLTRAQLDDWHRPSPFKWVMVMKDQVKGTFSHEILPSFNFISCVFRQVFLIDGGLKRKLIRSQDWSPHFPMIPEATDNFLDAHFIEIAFLLHFPWYLWQSSKVFTIYFIK